MNCSMLPDRFIRGYRLLPLPEIGKWDEMAEETCGNEVAGRGAVFAVRFFAMGSQILPARRMQMPAQGGHYVTLRCRNVPSAR
jgi:hypothetical protein